MDPLDWQQSYETLAAGSPRRRILHIRHANARIPDRFELGSPQAGPIAVVGLGPSLLDTWEELAGYDHILTTSGAHAFLIQRGIVPTWHVEVDTRAHKVEAMGPPHKDVQYLIGSTVHPALLAHLRGFQVRLFQPLSQNPAIIRELPRGEWCISAGGSVGNKALVLARMLGFTNIHVYGMDSSLRQGVSHASPHPNAVLPENTATCDYNGRTFETTPALLSYAQIALRVVDRLFDATFTFHGDGLLQAMFKGHTRAPNPILFAAQKSLLVTPAYLAMLKTLHAEEPGFGSGETDENRERMVTLVKDLQATIQAKTILDYGCGKGCLADDLEFPIWEYDPAMPGKDRDARPAELVICTDTLEHVEPECLLAVLRDLRRVTQKVLYLEIRLTKAKRVLTDGRNAHLIQESSEWWLEQLEKHFVVIKAFTIQDDESDIIDLHVWAGAYSEDRFNTVPGGSLSLSFTPIPL